MKEYRESGHVPFEAGAEAYGSEQEQFPGEQETTLLDASVLTREQEAGAETGSACPEIGTDETILITDQFRPAHKKSFGWQYEPITVIECNGEAEQSAENAPLPGADCGETVLLTAPGVVQYRQESAGPTPERQQKSVPVLVRLRTGERFPVNRQTFVIGTDRTRVDCWIRDNRAISRCRAEICERSGRYYIRDTKSLNFTYLNHVKIEAYREYQLHNYESIIFGNEEFRFEF